MVVRGEAALRPPVTRDERAAQARVLIRALSTASTALPRVHVGVEEFDQDKLNPSCGSSTTARASAPWTIGRPGGDRKVFVGPRNTQMNGPARELLITAWRAGGRPVSG